MPIVFALFLLAALPVPASLSGTWSLERVKSDFGAADAPKRFVLELEQNRNQLAATVFTEDGNGSRVSYRECRIEPPPNSTLACLLPDGVDETWQVTSTDELTITRVITDKSQRMRQRLVLARSAVLE